MIITVASGKGGTGKTTVAVNLATVLARSEEVRRGVCLLDCDVEEPNDHLFLQPRFTHDVAVEALKPVWHEDRCTGCGRCGDACNYNAIAVVRGRVLLFPELCHACGVCSFVCPEGAITERESEIGRVQLAPNHPGFAFGHGVLHVGESLAPRLVAAVKSRIRPGDCTIIDAAPGTACPVVEAVRGSDLALLVTEPTPFGLSDLRLAVGLSLKVGVPCAIVVNRSDGSDDLIQQYADRVGVPVVGRIPLRREYAETYSRGELLVDHHPELHALLMDVYRRACEAAAGPPQPEPPEVGRKPVTRPAGEPVGPGGQFRELAIVSGKGGTGKTTIAASLAELTDGKVLADCDVDAADLHLLLRPETREVEDFVGGYQAAISRRECVACGDCHEMCHFDAIEPVQGPDGGAGCFRVDQYACEGCGLCTLVCPVDAVELSRAVTGQVFVSGTARGALSHARLGIAEENSGKLVTRVRERAAELVAAEGAAAVFADGSPGTGCPVIASISGAGAALVVTEPTVSGVHDLERVLDLVLHFRVRPFVCINKCDLNSDQARRVREVARSKGAEVLGEVPFDEDVNRTLMEGKILVAASNGPAASAVRDLARALSERL